MSDGIAQVQPVPGLRNHEEADTCLILHASHASGAGYACVVIKSPDTNLAILAFAHSHAFAGCQLLFLTGTK